MDHPAIFLAVVGGVVALAATIGIFAMVMDYYENGKR